MGEEGEMRSGDRREPGPAGHGDAETTVMQSPITRNRYRKTVWLVPLFTSALTAGCARPYSVRVQNRPPNRRATP